MEMKKIPRIKKKQQPLVVVTVVTVTHAASHCPSGNIIIIIIMLCACPHVCRAVAQYFSTGRRRTCAPGGVAYASMARSTDRDRLAHAAAPRRHVIWWRPEHVRTCVRARQRVREQRAASSRPWAVRTAPSFRFAVPAARLSRRGLALAGARALQAPPPPRCRPARGPRRDRRGWRARTSLPVLPSRLASPPCRKATRLGGRATGTCPPRLTRPATHGASARRRYGRLTHRPAGRPPNYSIAHSRMWQIAHCRSPADRRTNPSSPGLIGSFNLATHKLVTSRLLQSRWVKMSTYSIVAVKNYS
jgi:hypothetical protein